jgi:hypothetical protein
MDGVGLLNEARKAGLTVEVDGDKLRIRGPRRLEPLALTLLRHKADVVTALRGDDQWARRAAGLLATVEDADFRTDLRELFEHRVAVCEFDGGLSLTEAERIAFGELQVAMQKWTDHRVRRL